MDYTHCNHYKQQRESIEPVHQAFNELLKNIEIDSDAYDLYSAYIANLMGESQEKGKLEAKNLKEQLEKITKLDIRVKLLISKKKSRR